MALIVLESGRQNQRRPGHDPCHSVTATSTAPNVLRSMDFLHPPLPSRATSFAMERFGSLALV